MTPFDESAAIEAMARGIANAMTFTPWSDRDWAMIWENQQRRNSYETYAKAALSALRPFLGDVRAQTIEECAAVADEWYRQFCTADPKFISAGTFARDAVADIADEIRGLKLAQSPTPPDSMKEGS